MTPRRRAGPGRLRLLVVAVCLASGCGVLGAAGWLATSSASTSAGPGPIVNRGQLPDGAAGPSGSSSPPAGRPNLPGAAANLAWSLAAGSRLQLPRLGVDATIVGVSAPGGVMQVPADPGVLGWWSDGSSPGGGRGHVVIVGHINYHGAAGALAALPDLQPGDAATLRGPKTVARYTIRAVRTYPKSEGLPSQVFDRAGAEELVLITCGGAFDASSGNYEDNIVAYATPAG